MNEDCLLAVKLGESYLLVVADGLGGHAAGEVASSVAVTQIEESMRTKLPKWNLVDTMGRAMAKANREIYLLSEENPAYEVWAYSGLPLKGKNARSHQKSKTNERSL